MAPSDSQSPVRPRVAVIFGGQSSEHNISCLSAASVLAALDRERYEVVAIGITREGGWYSVSSDPADWARKGSVLPEVIPTETPMPFSELQADVVFPVLHGPYGEDGTIQGALELKGIPYVGSGVLASALTMDKYVTKKLLEAAGLPIGKYVCVTNADWTRRRERILQEIEQLQFPVFVKPARAGSSVGITKVHDPSGLPAAIEIAREQDPKVLIEQSIENAREVECGILASPGFDEPMASVCAEITVGGEHEFYDFDAKYLDNSATLTVPADLPDSIHKELGEIAISAFQAAECDGLARVDFFIDPAGRIVINEINTMPGFTSTSMFPRMWEASGWLYSKVVDHLIQVALARGPGFR